MSKESIKLIVNGRRIDGRLPEEVRRIEMEIDPIGRADGSARVKFGNTEVIASVYGPRALYPKFLQEIETGMLRVKYGMAPFSVDERKSPVPDRRSIELSKVIRLALEPTIFLEEFPRAVVDVFIDVIQADGSTRVTGINAASLALAAAGVPMRDLVCACSVGKINGTLIVDLNGKEDNSSDADVTFAMLPGKQKISLLQMDGRLTKDELLTLLKSAKKTCERIYEMQRKVLREKFKVS